MKMKRICLTIALLAGSINGCGTSWDIGHNQSIRRDGWSIHLQDISDDSVTESDAGTTVSTGGHTIVVKDGVTFDGRRLAADATGEVTITRGNGTVSVAINGHKIETD